MVSRGEDARFWPKSTVPRNGKHVPSESDSPPVAGDSKRDAVARATPRVVEFHFLASNSRHGAIGGFYELKEELARSIRIDENCIEWKFYG